jgi:hypothetical protein
MIKEKFCPALGSRVILAFVFSRAAKVLEFYTKPVRKVIFSEITENYDSYGIPGAGSPHTHPCHFCISKSDVGCLKSDEVRYLEILPVLFQTSDLRLPTSDFIP